MNKFMLVLSALLSTSLAAFCSSDRDVDITYKKHAATIKGTTKDKTCKDILEISLKTNKNDGIEFRMDYKTKDKGSTSKFHVRTKAYKLIEFVDANNDNTVQQGEIVQSIQIGHESSAVWKDITHETTTVDGTSVEAITAQSGDLFKVVARYAGNPVTFTTDENNNTKYTLNPLSVKMDFVIMDFPYLANHSKLAIDGRFKTKAKFSNKRRVGDDENLEMADAESGGAKFGWVTEAKADGETVRVIGSALVDAEDNAETDKDPLQANEANRKIIWVFNTTNHPKTLFWDPVLSGLEPSSGVSVYVSLSALLLSLVFGLMQAY